MKALKQHYHWIVALIVFIEMIIYGGFLSAESIFMVPITESMGLTRGSYSLALIPRGIVGFFSTLIAGFLFHQFGYRKCSIVGMLLFCGGLISLAFAKSLAAIGIFNCILGISCGFCSTGGAIWIVKSWFHKHQGLMLGIVTIGTSVGGSVMSMTLAEIILISNWRYAYIFSALLIVIPTLLYLLLRDTPEQMGLHPYGDVVISGKTQTVDASHNEWRDHTVQNILRKPQFYLMTICTFLSCTTVFLTFNVVAPHFQDGGFSASEAAGFQSVLFLCLICAKFAGGWLIDWIGVRRVTLLCIGCAAAGQFLLADVSNPVFCYIGIVLFSVGLLPTTITVPLLTMSLFDYRVFGSITGIFLAMIPLANMAASPIINLFYDWLGSYSPVFRIAALIDIGLIGLYLLLFYLCEKEK